MVLSVLAPTAALAAADPTQAAQGPAWWEGVTGIIAIPAGVLGLFYTWALIRKTMVETTRTEIEIQEKQSTLAGQLAQASAELPATPAELIAEPIVHGQRVQVLVVRLIVFLVVLEVWNLAGAVVSVVGSNGLQALFRSGEVGPGVPSPATGALEVLLAVLLAVPQVGRWLVVLGLGWPLLLDALAVANIDIPGFMRTRSFQRVLLALGLVAPVTYQISQLLWSWAS